jgi:glycosyltransferase involved in cell wall biosynthesis
MGSDVLREEASEKPGNGAAAGDSDEAPAVSVVMPVHNALLYLDECVRSILGQTFSDFEFVILDDASNDGSAEALRRWARADARIRLFTSREKLGLSGSSNFVARRARAPLVARMDADDVAHPERLARQVEVFRNGPEVVLVGALSEGIDSRGARVRPRDRWRLVRPSLFPPFPHSSAMFRRRVFEEVGGYREECAKWEDQDLFLRMARRGRTAVLPEPLIRYRYHASNSTGVSPDHNEHVYGLRERCLEEFRAGRDYVRLLEAGWTSGASPRARAEALYQAGAMRLWAGGTPGIFGTTLRGGKLGRSPRALLTHLMATWGHVSPASLRYSLRCFIRARDLLAARRVKDGGVYDWRPE